MALLDSIDNYCERLDATFWSEPVNALTNIIYLIVFIYCGYFLKKSFPNNPPKLLRWIQFTILLTALGSFTFHTTATKLSMWGDILPILLFLLSSLYFILTKGLLWSKKNVYVFLFIFLLASVTLCFPPFNKILNGSLLYLPTVFVLSYLAIRIKKMQLVLLLFFLALIARTFDLILCNQWPLGTHFIWHLLTGLVTLFAFQVMVKIELESGANLGSGV